MNLMLLHIDAFEIALTFNEYRQIIIFNGIERRTTNPALNAFNY